MRGGTGAEVLRVVDNPGIVQSGGAVVCFGELDGLDVDLQVDVDGQAVGAFDVRGPYHAVLDHTENLSLRTRCLHLAVLVAGMWPLEVLHDARVSHRSVRGHARLGSRAPFRFLHDDGEDESVVHAGLVRNLVDRVVDILDFSRREVGHAVDRVARPGHYFLVDRPHVVEGDPG